MSRSSLSEAQSSSKQPRLGDLPNPSSQDLDFAEIHGDPVPDVKRLTLWDLLYHGATQYIECEAIVSLWQTPDLDFFVPSSHGQQNVGGVDCRRYTFRELLDVVDRLAAALQYRGCRPGMRLAAVLWNSADWAICLWVSARLNMTFIPIDPRDSDAAKKMLAAVEPDVLVIQDSSELCIAQDYVPSLASRVLVQCGGATLEGWLRMSELLSTDVTPDLDPEATRVGPDTAVAEMQDPCVNHDALTHPLIIFTSGTTGNPKACLHSHTALISQTYAFDPNEDESVRDRWSIHTPVSHIFAINNAIRAWATGSATVFPSRSFDVDATLRALIQEKITIMSATPTLVKALLARPDFPDKSELSLSLVTLAATTITEADVKLCRDALGARHAIQAYGLTEGAPLVSCRRTDPMYQTGWHEGVGKVLPGSAVRICRPQSRDVLRRGEAGELHAGGTSLFLGYLHSTDEGDSTCYRDDVGQWLATGDRAMIDKDGVVHIMGRYREMIIRGGENIHPSKIEEALSVLPGLQAQVVGASDEIAGQLPVAIVELPENVTRDDVWREAAKLGPQYALKAVITLEELGLKRIPRTSLGKVKKELLKEAAEQYLAEVQGSDVSKQKGLAEQQALDDLIHQLTESWERVTGIRPSPTETISVLADSITLLRFCDHFVRQTGHRLYLPDLVLNQSVQEQAETLLNRSAGEVLVSGAQFQTYVLDGSKNEANSSTATGSNPGSIKTLWTPAAIEAGASTTAVAELNGVPIEGTVRLRSSILRMAKGQRCQSYHVRMVFKVRVGKGDQVMLALERALTHHSLMRAVLTQTERQDWIHVIAKAHPLLWEKLLHEISVDSEEEARHIFEDGSAKDHTSAFMFDAKVIHVQQTDTTYVSMTFNHSIADALNLLSWHRDIDRLIDDPQYQVPTRVPFEAFGDLLWQYEDSRPSRSSVDFHVRKLRGTSRCKDSLWPVPRAPGWMIGNDEDSEAFEERQKARKEVWNGEWEARRGDFVLPRRARVVHLPNMSVLRRVHGISPCAYAISALVMMNALRTGSLRAIFNTWESGRTWPFVPPWVEKALPSAMEVDGPTFEWVLQMFEIDERESALEFLQRISREQEELSRHQHAPWHKIVEELRDEGPVAVDASYRQSFVWDVSIGLSTSTAARDDFKSLEFVSRYDWPDCGIFWNAFMVSDDSLFFIASWDTAHMNDVEIDECCDLYASILRTLGSPENWSTAIGSLFKN